jgi:hypothetical protein
MDTVCWRCGAVYDETRHRDRCPRCLVPEPRSSSGSSLADAPTPPETPVPAVSAAEPSSAASDSAPEAPAAEPPPADAPVADDEAPGRFEDRKSQLPPPPGVAWERREETGVVRGLAATILDFLFRPRQSALDMRLGEGIADPLVFVLIAVTAAVALVLSSGGIALALGLRTVLAASASETVSRFFSLTWGSILLAIAVTPLVVLVWIFVVALFLHLIGMAVGLDRKGFEATFRAVAYATGATSVVAVVPFFGAPLSLVWWLVSTGGALAGAHRAPAGRAAATVLLPFFGLLLAGGAVFFFLLAFAGTAMSGGG